MTRSRAVPAMTFRGARTAMTRLPGEAAMTDARVVSARTRSPAAARSTVPPRRPRPPRRPPLTRRFRGGGRIAALRQVFATACRRRPTQGRTLPVPLLPRGLRANRRHRATQVPRGSAGRYAARRCGRRPRGPSRRQGGDHRMKSVACRRMAPVNSISKSALPSPSTSPWTMVAPASWYQDRL